MDHARNSKIKQFCPSAIYKQNVSISLRLSDSVKCRRGYCKTLIFSETFNLAKLAIEIKTIKIKAAK